MEITPTELRILDVLKNADSPISQEEIALEIYYSRFIVKFLTRRLETVGIISRRRCPYRRGRPYVYQVHDVFSNS